MTLEIPSNTVHMVCAHLKGRCSRCPENALTPFGGGSRACRDMAKELCEKVAESLKANGAIATIQEGN